MAVKQMIPKVLVFTFQQREVVHGGWDKPKGETMEKYFALYPQ